MKTLRLVTIAVVCFGFTGCNAYQTALKAHDIVAAVIGVAEADLPSLEQTGVLNPNEGQAVTGYLNLATNLNGQYETCITNAQNTTLKKSSKFLACLQAFAAGLSNPQELASLRVLNPKAQQQVQLWITAASVGVSSVIAALGGQASTAPQVAGVNVSSADVAQFFVHACSRSVGISRDCEDTSRGYTTDIAPILNAPYATTEPYCPAGSTCGQ